MVFVRVPEILAYFAINGRSDRRFVESRMENLRIHLGETAEQVGYVVARIVREAIHLFVRNALVASVGRLMRPCDGT